MGDRKPWRYWGALHASGILETSVKYPGYGKSFNHEGCDIGLGGNVDTTGISKGYRSEPSISGEFILPACCRPGYTSPHHTPLFITVAGNTHMVLNVCPFTFLHASPSKTG